MPVGRNDPCPCGSGKKYKKCHGTLALSPVAVRPEAARANTFKALDVELSERLQRFALARLGSGWMTDAFDTYLDIEGGEVPEVELQLAIPWVLYHMPATRDGLTLADQWRRENSQRLPPDTRLLVDAHATSWLSIWEVAEVEVGVGASLVDQLTREERFVHDVRSSRTLQRLDALLAFVLDCDGVSFFGGLHGQPLPPREADAAVREARRICHVRTRPVPLDTLRDPTTQLELIGVWNFEVDKLRMKPPPRMQNTDGDPFQLTTDDFQLVAPRAEVAKRVEAFPGAQEPEHLDGDIVFAITKPGNAAHRDWDNTVVARVVLTQQSLRVDTNSTRRADTVRTALEAHLRGMVRHRLRTEANTNAMLEQARASHDAGEPSVKAPQPPELVAAMRELRERHMAAWLDDSIPALGGLTPRQAARMPRARPQLEVLLKEIERSEARLPRDERIDIDRVRRALELEADAR